MAATSEASSEGATLRPPLHQIFTNWTMNPTSGQSDSGTMERTLSYDLMLETGGVFRSQDVWTHLDRDLEPGETIEAGGRRWLVTKVVPSLSGRFDRRAVAREVVDEDQA